MKPIEDFLSDLCDLNVNLWIEEGEHLRCSAPQGKLTPELRTELKERKGEIIQFLKQFNLSSSLKNELIKPSNRSGSLPLSFAQERLWFLEQLEEASAVYNLSGAVHLKGKLNRAALEKSITEIVKRHEILRTRFINIKGNPVQILEKNINKKINFIDLKSLDKASKKREVERLIVQESQYFFNLEQGFLLRVTLLELDQADHILIVTMHHIISDGWSIGIFIEELSTLYNNFCLGVVTPLPQLPIQYADFAYWQKQWLKGERLDRQLKYWKQQLQGIPPLLALPSDRPRPAIANYRGSQVFFQLDQKLTEQLKQLCQTTGTTLFMMLLAAFAVLLFRYSSQEDIVIGSPIANRNRKEIEKVIGFFVNTLVLRIKLSENPSFYQLLQQIKQITLDAYAHQDLPFEKLVAELQPQRNLNHSPLFQVMFVLQNAPMGQLELTDLTATPIPTISNIAKFDLTLSMEETEEGLRGDWEYNLDLFNQETIERMSGHFQTLLQGIVAHAAQPIAQLPLLTEEQKTQLSEQWNQTEADYGVEQCIHHLFENQVEKTPNTIALEWKNQQLTYQELNRRANQLAHYLQSLGVGAEVLVGICLERSIDMIVGLLGIIKAGGAYVPLDAENPQQRLNYLISDSQIGILLTTENLKNKFLDSEINLVCLDRDWPEIAAQSDTNPSHHLSPENLAYIIYTSGSTGNPKGVMIEHRSLVSFTLSAIKTYQLSQKDKMLQFGSIGFDLAAEEIYSCLSCGGTLVLRTDEMIAGLETFLHKCQELELTVLDLPTAYWHQLASEAVTKRLNLPPSLRLVIIGGEKINPQKVVQWQNHLQGSAQLINTYGPTETTIVATTYSIPSQIATEDDLSEIPIGRPIENVKTYIVDRYQQPVPIGVPGELLIGGMNLARGYLNRSQLTTEKFIPNPFVDYQLNSPDSKVYKTGDLVRYLPDGNLEYLGRIDNQIKLRGFRIELGEIEASLTKHPDVKDAVVLLKENDVGDKFLVAYVVSFLMPERLPYQTDCFIEIDNNLIPLKTEDISARGVELIKIPPFIQSKQKLRLSLYLPGESVNRWLNGQVAWVKGEKAGIEFQLNQNEQVILETSYQYLLQTRGFLNIQQRLLTKHLRQYLKTNLPEYMIPSVYVLLKNIPLNSNGKIDRNALDKLKLSASFDEKSFVAPRNLTEESLVKIWAEVLNLEKVSIEDNFFELGGHSLLATQVMSRIRKTFALDLPLSSLFEYSTIALLAELIITKQLEEVDSEDLDKILSELNDLSDEEIKQQLLE